MIQILMFLWWKVWLPSLLGFHLRYKIILKLQQFRSFLRVF